MNINRHCLFGSFDYCSNTHIVVQYELLCCSSCSFADAFTSPTGITVLSRAEISTDHWARLGLAVPAPVYSQGAYDGAQCRPSNAELRIFACRSLRLSAGSTEADTAGVAVMGLSTEAMLNSSLASATSGTLLALKQEFPPPPVSDGSATAEKSKIEWMRRLLPPADGGMRRLLVSSLSAIIAWAKGGWLVGWLS
jgi:hypothetical protein